MFWNSFETSGSFRCVVTKKFCFYGLGVCVHIDSGEVTEARKDLKEFIIVSTSHFIVCMYIYQIICDFRL